MAQHSDSFDEIFNIEKILTKVRFEFALKCLMIVMDLNDKKNFVFSPYSIYEGLLLVYMASSGDTESQLKQKLELPNHLSHKHIKDWILHSVREKKEKYKKFSNYNEETCCWITNTPKVERMTQDLFHDELEKVNFHQSSTNLKIRINEVLKEKTKSYMHTPVQFNYIKENMEIILSNVLCLKGDTVPYVPFDAYRPDSLKIPKTVISPKLEMFVTELPFKDKNLSLFLLFTGTYMGHDKWQVDTGKISELVEKLTTKEGIDELRRVLNNQKSSIKTLKTDKVMYPNFLKLENELEIDTLLDKMGIKNLLEPDNAILLNFADQNLHLGDAKHRAYIKVTQKNVTAGAVNMFFTINQDSFKPTTDINDFECELKKFIWLLYCRESNTILFIGSVNEEKPSSTTKRKGFFGRIRQMFF